MEFLLRAQKAGCGNETGAVHWVAYDIPASKTSLAEGEASVSPNGWIAGKKNVGGAVQLPVIVTSASYDR